MGMARMVSRRLGRSGMVMAMVAVSSMALPPAHAQTVTPASRDEIMKACEPEIRRSMEEEKATTPKYLLDALVSNFGTSSYAYLMAQLPGKREQMAKFNRGQIAAEICTIELLTGQRKG
jgi:hypothetical protein